MEKKGDKYKILTINRIIHDFVIFTKQRIKTGFEVWLK